MLEADRRALKQIALNLLSNAVKFTPNGGAVSVHGRVRRGMVTIAISDNGIGIPKDALHKLGRPFEQVESQLTKRYQGSGLGLAIAKSLVEIARRRHAHPLLAGRRHDGGGALAAAVACSAADTDHEASDDADRETPDLWHAAGGGSVMPPTSTHAAIAMG